MSETTEEIKQDLLDIRYFSERMLKGLYDQNDKEQTEVLFDLAKLISITYKLNTVSIFQFLVAMWNGQTAQLWGKSTTGDETRQTVFRFFGEIFGKYGLPDPGYEEDEL